MMTGLQVILDCAQWIRARASHRTPAGPTLPDHTTDPDGFVDAVRDMAEADPGLMTARTDAAGNVEFISAVKAMREADAEMEEAIRLAAAFPAMAAGMEEEFR